MTTLSQVLEFLTTASAVERQAVAAVLGTSQNATGPAIRRVAAAQTLAAISEGDTVAFPYDNVQYTATVLKINTTTATVQITAIQGTPRRRIAVGTKIKVGASILARN